jgi:hypothetical protein
MSNDDRALVAEGRKQAYCMYFSSLKEINEEHIRALLFEAEMIDDGFKKNKKSFPADRADKRKSMTSCEHCGKKDQR